MGRDRRVLRVNWPALRRFCRVAATARSQPGVDRPQRVLERAPGHKSQRVLGQVTVHQAAVLDVHQLGRGEAGEPSVHATHDIETALNGRQQVGHPGVGELPPHRRDANDQAARIQIDSTPGKLEIFFDNIGPTLSEAESLSLFTPFFRGENASGKRGYGLGLVIAQRILAIHGASIEYRNPAPDLNRFVVRFTQAPFYEASKTGIKPVLR